MASAGWKKMTQQEAGAMRYHFQQEEREKRNHSNTNIDKSKTCENYTLGCDSYDDAYRRLNERNKAVDELIPPQRKRKDRVVACFIELPCLQSIKDDGNADAYFQKMFEAMQSYFGAENVHGAFIHKDEVHEYMDAKNGTYRESLEHMHVLVSPYTEKKGINGKEFETKPRLRALNELLNSTCEREFGIPLNTGKRPNRQSVEELKVESVRSMQEKYDELTPEVTKLEEKKLKQTALHKEKPTYKDYMQLKESNQKLKKDLKNAQKTASNEKKRADDATKKVIQYEKQFSHLAEVGVYERLPENYPEKRTIGLQHITKDRALNLIALFSSVGCRCSYDEQNSELRMDKMNDEGRRILVKEEKSTAEYEDGWNREVEKFRQEDSRPLRISRKERNMMDRELRDLDSNNKAQSHTLGHDGMEL